MDRFDRLTTLMDRFRLIVQPAPLTDATLVVLTDAAGAPKTMYFRTGDVPFDVPEDRVMFAAYVDWSSQSNPLLAALPSLIRIDLASDPDSIGLVHLMQSELSGQRCGVDSILSRLGEVLVVRMLRLQIEAGATEPGLLAGLSDARLSRAIVAMHDQPGRDWRNADLAQIAGLSLSRFAEMFLAAVGEPPAAYLRRWRLILARQDIAKGHRVEAVARRYGYGSPEGFTRAFKKHFGETPILLRAQLAKA
ncbi:AraC family transcriptional regulator [Yoonia sp.]|uniref:helix-turn-helix transcriptional regulator n=1 Tax=Yoonia sp. TaxID=2212373 RepID=UPI003590176D